jgi:transposase
LGPLFPRIQTVIADAGHESQKLAREFLRDNGWKLQIVKRRERAFRITGLTWIVERTFAWLGRNRRLSKDYEYAVQTSETMIDIAAIRLMLNRLIAGNELFKHPLKLPAAAAQAVQNGQSPKRDRWPPRTYETPNVTNDVSTRAWGHACIRAKSTTDESALAVATSAIGSYPQDSARSLLM